MAVDLTPIRDALRAAGFYDSELVVWIETPEEMTDGFKVSADPVERTTIVECEAQVGIPTQTFDERASTNRRQANLTEVHQKRQANLDGYFPEIDPEAENLGATVDGLDYAVIGVVHGSQKDQTQLLLERVTA